MTATYHTGVLLNAFTVDRLIVEGLFYIKKGGSKSIVTMCTKEPHIKCVASATGDTAGPEEERQTTVSLSVSTGPHLPSTRPPPPPHYSLACPSPALLDGLCLVQRCREY